MLPNWESEVLAQAGILQAELYMKGWGQVVMEMQIICLIRGQTFLLAVLCWVFSGIILISPARLLLLVCVLPTAAVIAASPCLLRRFMVCIFLCMVLLRCLKNVPANQALMDHSPEKINSCLLPWSLCYGTV